jgi:hypothetical protein
MSRLTPGAAVLLGPRAATPRTAKGPTLNALPNPKLRCVYRLDAKLDSPVDLGDTPQGHRRIISLTRGHAAGPYFDAELPAAGGADWQILRASGRSVADIRYTLKTDAGALLYVQSQGVRHGDPNVLARLAAGEDVDPSEYTFRASVTIETADPELAWVNNGVFIAVGGRRPPRNRAARYRRPPEAPWSCSTGSRRPVDPAATTSSSCRLHGLLPASPHGPRELRHARRPHTVEERDSTDIPARRSGQASGGR